jgi:hypothetical protein
MYNYTSPYTHLHGYIFDHIFKYCPKLKKMHLCNMLLDYCDPNLVVNNSIEELALGDCHVGEGAVLTALSARLPD